MLALDVNGDGKKDLIVTGNNYGTDVEQGQSDASIGCVLIGDGQGGFKALSPLKSGFSVIGDTRGVYQLKDKNGSIIVLRNNGKPAIYRLNKKTL